MAKAQELGASLTIDIEDLKNGITQANRLMRLADSEFKAAAASLGNWADSADGLTAKQNQLNTKIDLQNKKLAALKEEYDKVADAQGESSAAAQNLLIRIQNETAALNKNKREVDNVTQAKKELEESAKGAADAADDLADSAKNAGDAAEDAGEGAGSFGERAKAAAVGGVKALAVAATGLVTAFLASAEATREYRTEMGKLNAAFTTAGHTTEAAKKTYEDLYAFMGEEDTAVEAANHLAKLTKNEEDLAKWTNIATGVFATFGDSLPIEGLTEAANETAKVGQVTGPLADALNWAGVSEDAFNASLAKCTTEQERQALITDTLNGLYDEASQKYQQVNGDVMEANRAQSALNDSMANLGKMAEPVTTQLKLMGAEALNAITGLLSGLDQVVKGNMSFGDWGTQVIEKLVTSITTAAPRLLQSGTEIINNLANGIQQNLPTLISKGLDMLVGFTANIRTGAGKLVDAGMDLILKLGQGIANSLPALIAKVPIIVSNIAGMINDNAPKLLVTAAKLIVTLGKGLLQAIPALITNIPKIIKAIVDAFLAFSWIGLGKKAFTFLKDGIAGMKGAIAGKAKEIGTSIVNAIKNLPATLKNLGSNAIKNMGAAITGAKNFVINGMKTIFNSAVSTMKKLPGKMLSIGKDIVKGLWNGISNMTSWVIDKIQGFGDSVLKGLKSFFKIKSPSQLMRDEVGKHIATGVAEGIKQNTYVAVDAAKKLGKDVLEKAKEAEKKYADSVSDAMKKLQEDIKGVINEYENEVQARTDAITGSMSLWDAFEKKTEQTSAQLIANLESQVKGLQDWMAALDQLEGKNIDAGLLDYLRGLGPSAAGEVETLNSMTEEQLNQYVALWQQKNNLAREEAKKELVTLQEETVTKIGELIENTKTSIAGYQEVYDKALKDLGVKVKKSVYDTDKVLKNTAAQTILTTAPKVGKDMVDGIITGLHNREGALYSTISGIISRAIAAAQAAAEIASPSKVMRDLIGKNLIRGAIVGIEAESGNLYTTMQNVVDNTIGAAQGGTMQAQAAAGQPAGTVVYFTQNNTSPKALSPYEVYRQTKIANKMILEGR